MTDPMIVFFGGSGIMPYTLYDVKSFFATLELLWDMSFTAPMRTISGCTLFPYCCYFVA